MYMTQTRTGKSYFINRMPVDYTKYLPEGTTRQYFGAISYDYFANATQIPQLLNNSIKKSSLSEQIKFLFNRKRGLKVIPFKQLCNIVFS